MRVQLWSYNYDPEPTGIGIVSTVWARGLRDRGHEIEVVAAHPHYPEPRWGTRARPYREVRDGIGVLRLRTTCDGVFYARVRTRAGGVLQARQSSVASPGNDER